MDLNKRIAELEAKNAESEARNKVLQDKIDKFYLSSLFLLFSSFWPFFSNQAKTSSEIHESYSDLTSTPKTVEALTGEVGSADSSLVAGNVDLNKSENYERSSEHVSLLIGIEEESKGVKIVNPSDALDTTECNDELPENNMNCKPTPIAELLKISR